MKTSLREINSQAQLAELEQQTSAVVFLWVAWAIHARKSEKTALEMVKRWNESHPQNPLALLKIDLSDQTGAVWDAVDAWLTSGGVQSKDTLMYGGAGSLVWVRSGQIVEHVVNANAESVDRLLDMTEKVFGAALER